MADVNLAAGYPVKRNVGGSTHAARSMGPVTAAQNEDVQVCELPLGALVTDIKAVFGGTLGTIGNLTIGIEGANVTDDPDFFLAAAAVTAGATLVGNLQLPYLVETEGESITVRASGASGIQAAATGQVAATYTMDGFVDNTDQNQLLSSA